MGRKNIVPAVEYDQKAARRLGRQQNENHRNKEHRFKKNIQSETMLVPKMGLKLKDDLIESAQKQSDKSKPFFHGQDIRNNRFNLVQDKLHEEIDYLKHGIKSASSHDKGYLTDEADEGYLTGVADEGYLTGVADVGYLTDVVTDVADEGHQTDVVFNFLLLHQLLYKLHCTDEADEEYQVDIESNDSIPNGPDEEYQIDIESNDSIPNGPDEEYQIDIESNDSFQMDQRMENKLDRDRARYLDAHNKQKRASKQHRLQQDEIKENLQILKMGPHLKDEDGSVLAKKRVAIINRAPRFFSDKQPRNQSRHERVHKEFDLDTNGLTAF